ASNSHKTFDDKTLALQDNKTLVLQDNKTLVLQDDKTLVPQDNSILDPKDDQCELVTVDSGVAAMTESTFADAELSIEAAGSTTSKTDKASTVDASP
ncbi:unnamed protein product, partial [Aphanomyces euteiches]